MLTILIIAVLITIITKLQVQIINCISLNLMNTQSPKRHG